MFIKWVADRVRPVIKEELEQFKSQIKTLIENSMAVKGIRATAYNYLDGILAEGQAMSKDKLDAWWIEKRSQLKAWARDGFCTVCIGDQ